MRGGAVRGGPPIVQVRKHEGEGDASGEKDPVDDGALEHGQVRENECVDIDDYREMDEECASAPVSEEYGYLVRKKLCNDPGLSVEKLHPYDGHERAYRRIGQIHDHILPAPDIDEQTGDHKHSKFND